MNYCKERLALDALFCISGQPATALESDNLYSENSAMENALDAMNNRLLHLQLNALFESKRRNVDVKDYPVHLAEVAKTRQFCKILK